MDAPRPPEDPRPAPLSIARTPLPDDDFPTSTSAEQERQEEQMASHFAHYAGCAEVGRTIALEREAHIRFCLQGLETMPSRMVYLDCSRTWLCYWMLHSLELLGWRLTEHETDPAFQQKYTLRSKHIVDWVSRCFMEQRDEAGLPYGGYGGGPDQLPHLAPTYAAVCVLCIIGTAEAYASIPREPLLRWMLRLKTADNSFQMHEDGEVDIRSIYTTMAVAALLDLRTPELVAGVADYLLTCQTFEGGLGCEPYDEAHGGYTFCGLAALTLLGQAHRLDVPALLRWITARQKRLEGGFDGRTNKLVDSCYSFWVGAAYCLAAALLKGAQDGPASADVAIMDYVHAKVGVPVRPTAVDDHPLPAPAAHLPPPCPPASTGDWFFDEIALQEYLLFCCQEEEGGLCDKPEKPADHYHTSYALSGLSISQNVHRCAHPDRGATVLGQPSNLLECNNPLINITQARVQDALRYFGNRLRL